MASGESAEQKAAVSRARAANYRSRAERAESAADDWERGARAEVALAEVVAPLAADGYYQLDDRRFPGSEANIDHILVGPAGVFLIDSKDWSGQVQIDETGLRQNGRRRDAHVDNVRAQARQLAALLDEMYGPRRPEVRPAICFHGPARLGAPASLARVRLLDVDHVLGFVRDAARHCERLLDQAAVDEIMRGLLERLPARTAPVTPPAVPQAPRPEHPVVFLRLWARAGKRRLYARADDGSDIGFLDVATGRVETTAEQWAPVLAQLLPHYTVASAEGVGTGELSSDARGTFRRFLDTVLGRDRRAPVRPLLVGYHWKNYGKERLYVHRIDGSTKRDLGHFDLKTCVPRATPGDVDVVAYCGGRFLETARR